MPKKCITHNNALKTESGQLLKAKAEIAKLKTKVKSLTF